MTPDERRLLVAVAVRVAGAVGSDGNCDLGKLAEVVATIAPVPLTPRPKYVRIEEAPDLTGIAEKWKRLRGTPVWQEPNDEPRYQRLIELGTDPDRNAVKAVLNASWTHLSCDGCDESELVRAVRIEGPYGDGNRYCPTCIREAAAILDTIE